MWKTSDGFAIILTLAGIFFLFSGLIGLLRFPDLYSRMHATGKCDTLGVALSILGLIFYEGCSLISLKLFFILVFIFLANPTATHAIARAAFRRGIKPWGREER